MKNVIIDNRITAAAYVPLKRKFKDSRGFSLAETLLAVLILLLVSVVVATGMPAATNAYNKVILGANAKVMLSTVITALHDEIGTAWCVETDKSDTTKLTYFNASTGAKSELSLNGGKAIQVQDYLSLSDDLIHDEKIYTSGDAYDLVVDPEGKMYATYTKISYDDAEGIVTIEGLKVVKAPDGAIDLAKYAGEDGQQADLKIRVISKDVAETGT